MRPANTSGSPKVCPAASNHLTRSARTLTFTFSDVAGVASWKSSTEASRSGRAIWPRRRTRSPGGACLIWPRGTTSRVDLEQVADGRRRHAQRRQPCSSPDPAKPDARQLVQSPGAERPSSPCDSPGAPGLLLSSSLHSRSSSSASAKNLGPVTVRTAALPCTLADTRKLFSETLHERLLRATRAVADEIARRRR
ncbi:hypothetical protein ABIG06_001727 [Bradyrhizobium sp. USDA 326]